MKTRLSRAGNRLEQGSPLLDVGNVRAGYGGSLAVQGVSLTVGLGECVGVLGPNGAGKTSLLRTVSGTIGLVAGSVHFAGQDITGAAPHLVAGLGVAHVPEGRCIYPALTVEENLRLGLFARGEGRRDRSHLSEVVDLFPWIGDRLQQIGYSLSGGEQQMLAVARGLMSDPLLLVLDEPSLGLSPMIVDRIFETLELVRARGTSILIVEQSVDRLLAFADRAYVMNRGEVVLDDTAEAFRTKASVYSAYLG